jgi:hypothetical protein
MENIIMALDDLAALAGQGARLEVQVHGSSMQPWIYDGDVVRLESLPATAAQRGDVLLAREAPARLTLHRVVETRRASNGAIEYRLRGDAGRRSVGVWVGQEAVQARVTGIRRQGRFWSTQTPCYRAMLGVWLALRDL